jgi:hypothetical protein
MNCSAYQIFGFSILLAIVVAGCRPGEVTTPKPVPPKTEHKILSVVTVGMDMESATEMMARFSLAAVEEESGMAMVGAAESRRLRVGVNPKGDALYLIANTLPNGSEVITDMFWHLNWASELNLPKSERKEVVTDVDTIDLNNTSLKTFNPRRTEKEVDRDPFGG